MPNTTARSWWTAGGRVMPLNVGSRGYSDVARSCGGSGLAEEAGPDPRGRSAAQTVGALDVEGVGLVLLVGSSLAERAKGDAALVYPLTDLVLCNE